LFEDILIAIGNGLAQAIVTWYAVHIFVNEHRIRNALVIGLLGIIGIGLTVWATVRNGRAQTELKTELDRIERNTKQPPKVIVQAPPPIVQLVPSKTPKIRPDISLRVVYPEGFATILVNDSSVVLRDPKFFPVVWDLDLPDRTDPLPVPTETFTGEFIRPHEYLGPEPIVAHQNAASLVKPGHRLFGYIQVECPDCERTKGYWVWAINGTGGWYAELPPGHYAALNALFKLLPRIKADPDQSLRIFRRRRGTL